VVSPQPKEAIGSPAYFALLRSMTAQKRLIEAGIGIALLPESSVHEGLRFGTLATIDVSHPQTTVPIYVLYRKNGYLTGAGRTLLTLISNVPVRPSSAARQNRKRKSSPPGFPSSMFYPRSNALMNIAHVGYCDAPNNEDRCWLPHVDRLRCADRV
jgi:LysR substrate binding domain